jgi:hypothetical protein
MYEGDKCDSLIDIPGSDIPAYPDPGRNIYCDDIFDNNDCDSGRLHHRKLCNNRCTKRHCCKDITPEPPGPPEPNIIPAGTNILNNEVKSCNNNDECESNICDPVTRTCIDKCNPNNSCVYLKNDTNKELIESSAKVSSNCVKTSSGYFCPLGPVKCNDNLQIFKRLCDPSNTDCKSLGNKDFENIKCWSKEGYNDNRMPWIGYDYTGDKKYKVDTISKISTWCLN